MYYKIYYKIFAEKLIHKTQHKQLCVGEIAAPTIVAVRLVRPRTCCFLCADRSFQQPLFLFLFRLLNKMIDIIQWRVSIGLWNCYQSAAGPIRRGCRSIKTNSPNGKKKTRSLVLSLITVLLFVLTLISGYLEIKYNPPLRGII